jgi:glutamine phosphoribosylpyrophosphate amidotransferase
MCGVIGAIIEKPSEEDFDTIKRVFLESKIRGMHATGLSYVKGYQIYTEKLPVAADQFPFDFPKYVNEDGNLYLVGHCRYSTSDLEYNQPFNNDTISVVHNGVITQELPEKWKDLYGYDCITKNDSELLLHTLEDDKCPITTWVDSSLAVCELWFCKRLRFYRNGKRPIYFTCLQNGYIITSTEDVAKRAGLDMSVEVPMNTYMNVDQHLAFTMEKVYTNNADLQGLEYETVRI